MEKGNPMLECLARYSRANLALMVFDNLIDLPREIWRVSGRVRDCVMIADNVSLQLVLNLASNPDYDAILYRRIENLSSANQIVLNKSLVRMTAEQKGKFIFTTNNFDLIDGDIFTQVCRVKLQPGIQALGITNEPIYIDVEPKQKQFGRYC